VINCLVHIQFKDTCKTGNIYHWSYILPVFITQIQLS